MGNLCTYTFDEKGSGTASSKLVRSMVKSDQPVDTSITGSNYLRSLVENLGAATGSPQLDLLATPGRFSHRASSHSVSLGPQSSQGDLDTERIIRPKLTLIDDEKTKHYYQLKILPWKQASQNYKENQSITLFL